MDTSETFLQTEAANEGLPPLKGWRKTFAALRHTNFRYFFTGQTVSLIGTWARSSALGWLAFAVTKSEFLLGMVAVLNSLPIFIFAIYAGSLADRIPKLKIFRLTSWFSLLSSLLIAILLFRGPVGIGTLLVFSACWGIAVAFEMPARHILMTEMVGRKDMVNAIALNSAMVNSTRMIGPALGGLLYSAFGAAWCFFMDALSYLAVLFGIYKIHLPSRSEPKTAKGDLKYILEGFKHLKTSPVIAQAVTLLFITAIGGWAYISQMPAFVSTQLHLGAGANGWLLAMNGFGASAAALTVASMGNRLVNIQTLYKGIGIYSFFIVLFGFMRNPIGAAFLVFFAGFGIILFFSVGNSLIQTHSPDHLRGRLMGIWALVMGGGMPLGSFWMGLVASKTGSGISMQIGGLFCAVGSFLVYWFFKNSAPKRA